jgi:hypothetical protein
LDAHLKDALEGERLRAFEDLSTSRTLEQVLSRLRRIATLLEGDIGQKIDGLTGADASDLDREICAQIVAALSTARPDLEPVRRLASWAGRVDYHRPLELFTVNYDLLIEQGLESLAVPYFDGFVGTIRGRFRSELVEARADVGLPAFLARVWKLHGSTNWVWEEGVQQAVVRLGVPVDGGSVAAIYPSDAKYDESRRVPFVVLQDRFRRALNEPETLLLISGYAFGDDHLNEMIFDAARRRARSEFVAFCYSDIPEALASAAELSPNLQVIAPGSAVLGGVRADWKPAEDAPKDVWRDGHCRLGDFTDLSRFLARSSEPNGELENRLSELLARAVTGDAC